LTSVAAEERGEVNTSLEDAQFWWIATEAWHKKDAMRRLVCRHFT